MSELKTVEPELLEVESDEELETSSLDLAMYYLTWPVRFFIQTCVVSVKVVSYASIGAVILLALCVLLLPASLLLIIHFVSKKL